MRANLLICDESRKIYFMSRAGEGEVWNKTTRKGEVYNEKKWKHYAQYPKYSGGGIFIFPNVMDNILIVFEQKGKKPSKDDKIIETFGDVKIVKQTDP